MKTSPPENLWWEVNISWLVGTLVLWHQKQRNAVARPDTIRSTIFLCAQKLTDSQLNLLKSEVFVNDPRDALSASASECRVTETGATLGCSSKLFRSARSRKANLASILLSLLTRPDKTSQIKQEGQHPLTGQRAANFRLLANQWAERRLATQWRHGCRVNCVQRRCFQWGRSLCVQISRERSYPMQIYWYHSKGNWLRYNCAADIFYIMKLCSRRFVLYCRNCLKDDKLRYLIPILRKLGAA